MSERIARRTLGFAAGAALCLCASAVMAQQLAATTPNQVVIDDFAFSPATLTVAAGAQVTWVNQDEEPHTVMSVDKSTPFKSPALDTKDQFSFVFTKPGIYKYFCSIHSHMTGTIVVK